MLVLSRKAGQELIIGDNIRITVNRVGGSRVTLGISAPSDVRIVRGELARKGDTFLERAEVDETEVKSSTKGPEEGDPLHCSPWQLEATEGWASLPRSAH